MSLLVGHSVIRFSEDSSEVFATLLGPALQSFAEVVGGRSEYALGYGT
jgi:hypothetical protein